MRRRRLRSGWAADALSEPIPGLLRSSTMRLVQLLSLSLAHDKRAQQYR